MYTGRQLKAPSRSRCRRCLRILAIFRPAAPDEAARLFLLFSFSMSRVTISPALRREEKWQLLGIYTLDKFAFGSRWKQISGNYASIKNIYIYRSFLNSEKNPFIFILIFWRMESFFIRNYSFTKALSRLLKQSLCKWKKTYIKEKQNKTRRKKRCSYIKQPRAYEYF